MSRTLYENFNSLDIKSVRYNIVRILRKELAEFVQRKKDELDISFQAIADNSRGLLTHGTVWNIANERVKEIKETSLQGLAYAFGMTLDEIFQIAYENSPEKGEEFIKRRFENLSNKFASLDESGRAEIEPFFGILEREIEHRMRKQKPLRDDIDAGHPPTKTGKNFTLLPKLKEEIPDMDVVALLKAKTGANINTLHIEWYRQREENTKFLQLPKHIQDIITAYYSNDLDEHLQEREEDTG